MATKLQLGDIPVEVEFKDIKNVHLSVHPPTGRVTISAPCHMSLETVRVFAISKLDWVRKQQRELQAQERETPRELLDRESHFVWGERCLLQVTELDAPPKVERRHKKLLLNVRPGADDRKRREVLDAWYRAELKATAQPLIEKWEPIIGVKVKRLFVQRMKTKWGSCNPTAMTIRLNTELAKKPPIYLEYIIVHELTHFLVNNHGERFQALLKEFLPGWRQMRHTLNEAPLGHIDWSY